MKMKEYGTGLLSHDTSGGHAEAPSTRFNNTFKSSVMCQEPLEGSALHHAKLKERVFKDRIL